MAHDTTSAAPLPEAQGKPASPSAVPKQRWTLAKQRQFLSRLAEKPNVTSAARAVGMSRDSAYALRRRNGVFARNWADALEQGYSELEHLLLQQSLTGTERIENLYDADGTLKSVRTIRSFPLGDASRLLRAHRDGVTEHRARLADGDTGHDAGEAPPVSDRLRDEMARVQARLAGTADQTSEQTADAPPISDRLREEMTRVQARLASDAAETAEDAA